MLPLSVEAAQGSAATGSYVASGRFSTYISPEDFPARPCDRHASRPEFEFVGGGRWSTLVHVGSARVRPLRAFVVLVEQTAGVWSASHAETDLYGAGHTMHGAKDDFKAAALDLFEFLSGLRPDQLGPLPARQLEVLREHLAFV